MGPSLWIKGKKEHHFLASFQSLFAGLPTLHLLSPTAWSLLDSFPGLDLQPQREGLDLAVFLGFTVLNTTVSE